MLWQEQADNDNFVVPDDIQDVSFRFECAELPIDHASALKQAIVEHLPWIENEPNAAIHSIYGAASGNGWSRPEDSGSHLLQLSRRTRLYIRLPKSRLNDARALQDSTLMLGEFQIKIEGGQNKRLSPATTVFARSVCSDDVADENQFIENIAQSLASRGIRVRKMLCGLSHQIQTPDKLIIARSVLISDLDVDQSIELQENGIGEHQLLGCGIFLPHKSLSAVGLSQEN